MGLFSSCFHVNVEVSGISMRMFERDHCNYDSLLQTEDQSGDNDDDDCRHLQTCCSVATVLAAVALLPVHSILQDSPVTHPGHTSVRHTGAPPEHLPPPPVPDEAPGTLLHDLDTECSSK